MTTFFIGPENFESLSQRGQSRITEKINEALKNGLMISPRGERLDGFGNVLVSVSTMTAEEYDQYKSYGGSWEYISGVEWFCERLDYENHVDPNGFSERGAA